MIDHLSAGDRRNQTKQDAYKTRLSFAFALTCIKSRKLGDCRKMLPVVQSICVPVRKSLARTQVLAQELPAISNLKSDHQINYTCFKVVGGHFQTGILILESRQPLPPWQFDRLFIWAIAKNHFHFFPHREDSIGSTDSFTSKPLQMHS